MSSIMSEWSADASESVAVRLAGSAKCRLSIDENKWPKHFLLNLELDSTLPNDDFVEPVQFAEGLSSTRILKSHNRN